MNEDIGALEKRILKELEINESKLNGELKNEPLKFFYWGHLWAKAFRAKSGAKLRLDMIQAKLSNEYRQRMREINPRERPLVTMVESYVGEQAEYNSARSDLIHAEYAENVFAVAKEAFQQRHSILVEVSKGGMGDYPSGSDTKHKAQPKKPLTEGIDVVTD